MTVERLNRNLDGVYLRVERDNKWQNICFSDLTEDEMDIILSSKPDAWLKDVCKILGRTIRDIGDQLDLICE